jgi:DNA-binding ferritin-like protein (Dps family)
MAEMAAGWMEQKRRYRQYKARTERLPAGYRAAADALERYPQFFGPGTSDGVLAMLEDLASRFERAVADGTPVRALVGEDPVEFAEALLRGYPEGQWITRERGRLAAAITRAAAEGTVSEGTSR